METLKAVLVIGGLLYGISALILTALYWKMSSLIDRLESATEAVEIDAVEWDSMPWEDDEEVIEEYEIDFGPLNDPIEDDLSLDVNHRHGVAEDPQMVAIREKKDPPDWLGERPDDFDPPDSYEEEVMFSGTSTAVVDAEEWIFEKGDTLTPDEMKAARDLAENEV